MAVVEVRGVSYHMNDNVKKRWDGLKDGKLAEWDEDRVYIVDGKEGSGKSLFTIQQASYIDPTILDDEDGEVLPRICFSVDGFLKAISKHRSNKTHTKCIIFDEAFRGMSSRASLSKQNRKVTTALMEVRQNNLVIFIVSPSFFMIDFYSAVLRSHALFHVVKIKKSRQRYVRVFNERKKAKLHEMGARKAPGYPIKTKRTQSLRFFEKYPGGKNFEKRYRATKRRSLKIEEEEVEEHRWVKQRNILIKELIKNPDITYRKLEKTMEEGGGPLSIGQISNIVAGK